MDAVSILTDHGRHFPQQFDIALDATMAGLLRRKRGRFYQEEDEFFWFFGVLISSFLKSEAFSSGRRRTGLSVGSWTRRELPAGISADSLAEYSMNDRVGVGSSWVRLHARAIWQPPWGFNSGVMEKLSPTFLKRFLSPDGQAKVREQGFFVRFEWWRLVLTGEDLRRGDDLHFFYLFYPDEEFFGFFGERFIR